MAIIFKKISVDVATENIFQSIVAKQYDTDSRFLTVQLTNEGENLVVDTTSTVVINALREDNEAKAFAGSVNEDGTVTVPITSWMLDLDGTVKCDISIYEAERKLTSTTFTISVEAASYAGNDIAEDENYDILVTLIAECQEIIDNASQLVITVDSELSAESENPVQNKAISNSLSNAVKGKVTGEILRIDDISPIPHSLKIRAESKNLVDFHQIISVGYSTPTLVDNGFVIEGPYYCRIPNVPVLPNTDYYLSFTTENLVGTAKDVTIVGTSVIKAITNGTGATFNSGNNSFVNIHFYSSMTADVGKVKFTNIQLEYGTQSTEYKPYVDVSDMTVKQYGKNLLDYHEIKTVDQTVVEVIKDGVRITGIRAAKIHNIPVKPNTNYTLSFLRKKFTANSADYVYVQSAAPATATLKNITGTVGTFNTGNTTAINIEFFASRLNTNETVEFTNIQLEPGTQQTEYEPYVPVTEATVSDDGTVEGLTSIYPNTVLVTDSENVTLECEYNRDLNRAIENSKPMLITFNNSDFDNSDSQQLPTGIRFEASTSRIILMATFDVSRLNFTIPDGSDYSIHKVLVQGEPFDLSMLDGYIKSMENFSEDYGEGWIVEGSQYAYMHEYSFGNVDNANTVFAELSEMGLNGFQLLVNNYNKITAKEV